VLKLNLFIIMVAGAVLGGCSSMQSTVVRNPENGFKGDGLPIVVERPRYLRVTEKEIDKILVLSNTESKATDKSPGVETGTVESSATGSVIVTSQDKIYTTTTVEYEVVSVGEVFFVDVRRPAAGHADFTLEFDAGKQYPKKITAKTEDKTIEAAGSAIGSLIENAAKVFKPTSGALTLPSGASTVDVATRVKRISLYDLDRLSDPTYTPVVLFVAPPK